MSGYLDRIKPDEREQLVEIDRAMAAIKVRRTSLRRRRKRLTEDEHWEFVALNAGKLELIKQRGKLVTRIACRVTYYSREASYWRRGARAERRLAKGRACAA